MAFQVGPSCYATVAHAGWAACQAYSPVSAIVANGATLRTVSCVSANDTTGVLRLSVVSTPTAGGASSTVFINQPIAFPPCNEADYVLAVQLVFAAVLAVWATSWGVLQVVKLLNWSRGDAS